MPKYSVIIPVFNRPQEIDELLNSLTQVNYSDFEVIVIEDGSHLSSEDICNGYHTRLKLQYHQQDNTGPGLARNKGAEYATGDYFLFLDSDCLIPHEYFKHVNNDLNNVDCFGGPDMAHESFDTIQKAISYSMTSQLTTGGIRGGKKKLDKFYPRSFNMGIKKEVFNELKGFSRLRFGEDLDFSMRILEAGYSTKLILNAGVFHKRRNNFRSFFKQVYNSGIARINLNYRHPGSLKLIHAIPTIFSLGYMATILIALFFPILFAATLIPFIIFMIDATTQTKNLKVGVVSSAAAMVQIFGYGLGFFTALISRKIFNRKEFAAYEKNFYD